MQNSECQRIFTLIFDKGFFYLQKKIKAQINAETVCDFGRMVYEDAEYMKAKEDERKCMRRIKHEAYTFSVSNRCYTSYPCQHDVTFTFKSDGWTYTVLLYSHAIRDLLRKNGMEENPHFLDNSRTRRFPCNMHSCTLC
jgi:hypothetical protein